MKWEKLGLVFDVGEFSFDWGCGGALTPTPVLLNENVIRVFCGFRDENGVSRIGFVDVDAFDPTRVLKVSEKPILELGAPGCFDDNGMIMGHIEKIGDTYYLYYVGFQLPKKSKFLAFTGLALSKDLHTFERYSKVPILDRSDDGPYINAIHSIIKNKDSYTVYFAAGDGWAEIEGKSYPKYHIFEADSKDAIHFENPRLVIPCDLGQKEYRIGRPSAFRFRGDVHMFFTKGSESGKDYFPGYAKKEIDGSWRRDDGFLGLSLGPGEFDSQHLCYPRFIEAGGSSYIFYNGNNMGKNGFAVAKLINWE